MTGYPKAVPSEETSSHRRFLGEAKRGRNVKGFSPIRARLILAKREGKAAYLKRLKGGVSDDG